MRKAYIVAAKRSAIGTFLGSLTDVDLATVGATVLKETIKHSRLFFDTQTSSSFQS